jgi:hypothetical protein
MPRKKQQPTTITETLDAVIEKTGLKPASEIPRQLTPAEPTLDPLPRAEQEPPPLERIEPAPNTARPRQSPSRNGEERPTFAAKVMAGRSDFRPVPPEFVNVGSYPEAGLKVNRSRDKAVVAIQFADDKLPDRAEKDLMQVNGINYDPPTKQWTRRDAENPGANAIDAKSLAAELVEGRRERGR